MKTPKRCGLAALIGFCLAGWCGGMPTGFVTVKGQHFQKSGKPYFFIGANYWYGSLLAVGAQRDAGLKRLRHELDFLKANGVTNLRVIAGAEGSGPMNGVTRVGPSIQPEQGKFDEQVLTGLDRLLAEVGSRNMTAVVVLSNNWEWSGGFQQYLVWNNVIGAEYLTRRPDWDELRDVVARFYSCEACVDAYRGQVKTVVGRRNTISGRAYRSDPAIMAWELANEPRPMRPAAAPKYEQWIAETSSFIRKLDPDHLITIGHEGRIGTENLEIYRRINDDPNIDYLTVHIWPKNWGWFENGRLAGDIGNVERETRSYIIENLAVSRALKKPMVIEEFGLPRDGQSFDVAAPTSLRDRYFQIILGNIGTGGVAGADFWAFGGTARPKKGQKFWKPGDDLMGDPPMEEQGLNTVFDTDASTWQVIRKAAANVSQK